jgi:hypothetical protein
MMHSNRQGRKYARVSTGSRRGKLRGWIVAICLLHSLGTVAVHAEQLDIRASLIGYNLIWPSTRCCAFDLHISSDGVTTLEVKINNSSKPLTEAQTVQLSPKQISDLKKLIEEVKFFSLPSNICCGPIDGDLRRITVRIGNQMHKIEFSEATPKDRRPLERAFKLWRAVRATIKIPNENIE